MPVCNHAGMQTCWEGEAPAEPSVALVRQEPRPPDPRGDRRTTLIRFLEYLNQIAFRRPTGIHIH